MFVYLNDDEVAVIIDSLAYQKRLLESEGAPHPNVDNALAKICSLMSPSTKGLKVEALP